jgi:predicted secreted protein
MGTLTSLFSCNSVAVNKQNSRVIIIEKCKLNERINVGDTVIVKMIQYPGRGLSWKLTDTPVVKDGLSFINKSFKNDPDSKDDGSQEVLFRFLVTSNTNLRLKFEYRRPWENNEPATDNCILNIKTD